jgi:transcriptional antiterminator NusG
MTMQGKMTGKKIAYRPMIEAELSSIEIDRAYHRATRADRIARIAATKLRSASMDLIKRKPKMANWYCLRVESGREHAVEKFLSEADVDVFMPVETVVFVRKGKKIEIMKPFFRSYMLVRCVPSAEAFNALRTVKYVTDIVGGPNGYHIIRAEDVERFRSLSSSEELPRIATDKTMKDGDIVEITIGPFAGFTCLIQSVKWCRQAKAKVVIDVMGKQFEIESMPIAFLKKS